LKNNHTYRLDPQNLQIDDRSPAELILFIKELSKRLHFFDTENKTDESWNELLQYDPTFLLAEIHTYPLVTFGNKRLSIIRAFDQAASAKNKWQEYSALFDLLIELFILLNSWYEKSRKNNLSLKSAPIEYELDYFINSTAASYLVELRVQFEAFYQKKNTGADLDRILGKLSTAWKTSAHPKVASTIEKGTVNYAMKRLILLFNKTYQAITGLVTNSAHLFNESLENNQNHKAHTGLIFTFLKLFKHLQIDINAISEKHLDLFYRDLLQQTPLDVSPSVLFSTVEISKSIDELSLSKGTKIKAGQYKDGSDILFETTESSRLNNSKISHLSTTFLSRSKTFEYNSRFNLISGIYTKTHASSAADVEGFNKSNLLFSSLGEEQKLRTTQEMNMAAAEVGFIISSPILQMGVSNRKVTLELRFDANSISYLTDLIIDISERREVDEEIVFSEIFSNAFELVYSGHNGWIPIQSFDVISPLDWTTGVITIRFELNKQFEAFSTIQPKVHGSDIHAEYPVLKFTINQHNFYNAYSFLNGMKLDSIDIRTEISGLKKVRVFTNGELVDPNSSFLLFGATPKVGSYCLIGSEELFNKQVSSLNLAWEYDNLPIEESSFSEYYKLYPQDIKNSSFDVKISALTDFQYRNAQPKPIKLNLFNEDKKGELVSTFKAKDINVEQLNIKPNYRLSVDDISNYSNDLETGFFKVELIGPKAGFGFGNYQKVYANAITKNALKKTKKGGAPEIVLPNEPYAPEISELTLGYTADTSIIFNQRDFNRNNFSEGNSFHLLSPYGVEDTFKNRLVTDDRIVYNLKYEGELVIGFDGCKPNKSINLLFEIIKSESTNYEFSRKLEWFYYSSEGWKLLSAEHIMYDQTQSLMRTGILSIRMPADATDKHYLFNSKKHFIKACSKNKSDQFSLIKSIQINAISAREIISELPDNRITILPPKSVQGLEENVKGITSISQRLQTIPGRNKETKIDFYNRVSELIRHKNRPITKWDFEKYVLANFPWLSHTKCFSSVTEKEGVKLLCIKKIDAFQNIDEIKLSSAEMEEIEACIAKVASPFAKIKVINPIFEDLWLKCSVSFKGISNGNGIEQLSLDLFNFLCPWLRSSEASYTLGEEIKLLDIVNFVKTRTYIDFVTGISIIHLKKNTDGTLEAYDSAKNNFENELIKTGSPWSLIVPKGNHKITILATNEFQSPVALDFKELGINTAFLINKNPDHLHSDTEGDDDNEDSEEFSFRLKI